MDEFLSSADVIGLIEQATPEELMALTRLFDQKTKVPYSPERLHHAACLAGSRALLRPIRRRPTGYLRVVHDVARKINVRQVKHYQNFYRLHYRVGYLDEVATIQRHHLNQAECQALGREYIEDAEKRVLLALLQVAYDKIPVGERADIDQAIRVSALQHGGPGLPSRIAHREGLMAIAGISGPSAYALITATIEHLSPLIVAPAVTLSVATVSAALAFMAAGSILHILGRPDYDKTIPFVAQMALLRQRITASLP